MSFQSLCFLFAGVLPSVKLLQFQSEMLGTSRKITRYEVCAEALVLAESIMLCGPSWTGINSKVLLHVL